MKGFNGLVRTNKEERKRRSNLSRAHWLFDIPPPYCCFWFFFVIILIYPVLFCEEVYIASTKPQSGGKLPSSSLQQHFLTVYTFFFEYIEVTWLITLVVTSINKNAHTQSTHVLECACHEYSRRDTSPSKLTVYVLICMSPVWSEVLIIH